MEKRLDPKVRIIWLFPGLVTLSTLWLFGLVYLLLLAPNQYLTIPFITPLTGLQGGIQLVLAVLISFSLVIGLPYVVWTEIQYRVFSYSLLENEVVIRSGVINKHRTVIPYERVQTVNLKRRFIERILGLSTLVIETAGTELVSANAIPGVLHTEGEELLREIMRRTAEAKGHKKIESERTEKGKYTMEAIFDELKSIRFTLEELCKRIKHKKKKHIERREEIKYEDKLSSVPSIIEQIKKFEKGKKAE